MNACTLGPDFVRPVAPATTAYTNEALPALAQSGGQQLVSDQALPERWWTQFNSTELDDVITQALAGNPGLDAAVATLAQAQEAVNASAGTSYPQLSLDAGAGRQKYGEQFGGPVIDFPPFTYFSIGPKVSYLLDYLGGQHRNVEQQKALTEFQSYQLDAARLDIVGQVLQQSFTIAAARAQIDAVEALLEEDQKNASLVQTAFEVGSSNRVDLLTAQSQLANDQTQLPVLRQQLSVAQHALSVLLGHAPADWTPPQFDLAQLQLPQSLPLSLPSELVHRRPDILAAEAQLHAATAAVGVATANLYPQFTLTASASQQSGKLSHLFDASSLAWGFAGDLSAPLLDGGTRHAQQRSSQAALRAAAANYQKTVLQSFGQVADVLTALEHDAESIAAQDNALQIAAATLQLTRESFRVGNTGVLQVLDAERLFQQAKLGQVRAQAQRYQDTAQLFLALGGVTPAGASGAN